MAYFKFKVNTAYSVGNIGVDIAKALKIVENCLNGSHTSTSTWGNLSGEDANIWDKDNSLVINDAAHRQTKHSGSLWSTSTNTSSSQSVYHVKANAYGYSTSYAYLDFYKRHYMNNNISGASTTTSFAPFVHFRILWASGRGWSIACADKNGANPRPINTGITSTSRYMTENTSNYEIGDGGWGELDEILIWQSETFFAIAFYENVGGVPSYNTRNSGKNYFFYWGDFPYIDSVDGYHYGRNSIYYPGCWFNIGMSGHDVRLPNLSPDTGDFQTIGHGRYGGVTGLNEYFNHPTSTGANLYLYQVGASYAQFSNIWPHPLSPRTQIPTANGTGPLMIPMQYNGHWILGRDESSSATSGAGTQAASAQNFGDARAGQMLGLYQVPDEFGTAPGDRFKVGNEFYRTVWTHKKGGSYSTMLDADNSETNVYALPEKSQIGPDPI